MEFTHESGASFVQQGCGQSAFSNEGSSTTDATETVLCEAWSVLDLLLYSAEAEAAFVSEEQRFRAKTSQAVQAYCLRMRSRMQTMSTVGCLEYSLHALSNVRTPFRRLLPPREHWTRLLSSLVLLINSVPALRAYALATASGSTTKIRTILIGLLYVAPSGISIDGCTYLVAEPALAALLPLQIFLWKSFGIHSKIITETENMVKTCLKEATHMGFDDFLLDRNGERPRCALSRGEGVCECQTA